jgi:hypothetical protein
MRILVLAMAMLTAPALADNPAPSSTAPAVNTVNLVCIGGGAANRVANSNIFATNSDGDSAWGTVTSQRSVGFEDQVTLEIDGDAGRIRMPRSMLPAIRGGKDGWFEVRHVKWSENEVTGTIQVNVLNSPKLRLDRLQGMIAINGKAGDFSGRCETFDPAAVQRKF